MSDARRRALQRRAAAGDLQAALLLLRERARTGDAHPDAARVVAWLGVESATDVGSEAARDPLLLCDPDAPFAPEVGLRALVAAARALAPSDDPLIEEGLRAAEEWLEGRGDPAATAEVAQRVFDACGFDLSCVPECCWPQDGGAACLAFEAARRAAEAGGASVRADCACFATPADAIAWCVRAGTERQRAGAAVRAALLGWALGGDPAGGDEAAVHGGRP